MITLLFLTSIFLIVQWNDLKTDRLSNGDLVIWYGRYRRNYINITKMFH